MNSKKRHTAYCSSNYSNNERHSVSRQDSWTSMQKCAHPECEYVKNSDPFVSLHYCCEKCEGLDKGEPWAEGGKRHYKSCEKRVFTVRWGEAWAPTTMENSQTREPLERHRGAERDTRPAWMTKGVGVNQEVFGDTKGDLVKPGMTKADLEKLEQAVRSDSPDPMRDFLSSRGESPRRSRSPVRRAPLPDQTEHYWAEWK